MNLPESVTADNFTVQKRSDTYEFIRVFPEDMVGRKVLITGASKGIGRAIAKSYARAGASGIAIAARSSEALQKVCEEIMIDAREMGLESIRVLVVPMDITQQSSVEKAAATVRDEFGGIDVLINNAGYMAGFEKLAESDPTFWWKTFELNVYGSYLACRSFVPLLIEQPEGLKTLVQVVSVGAHHRTPGGSAYGMSKLCLIRMSDFLLSEYAAEGLLAYSINPGGVATELGMSLPPFLHRVLTDTPELAGDSVVWMTKERRMWMAGRYINVQWDMQEFEARRDEIERENLLRVELRA